jgi:hypothetical protein
MARQGKLADFLRRAQTSHPQVSYGQHIDAAEGDEPQHSDGVAAPLATTPTVAAGRGGEAADAGMSASANTSSLFEWACTRCTFVNSKPDAPVCELCGSERAQDAARPNPSATGDSVRHNESMATPMTQAHAATPVSHATATTSRRPTEPCTPLAAPGSFQTEDVDASPPTAGAAEEASPQIAHLHKKRKMLSIGSFGGSMLPPTRTFSTKPVPNPDLDGLHIVYDFIDADTEAALIKWLDTDGVNPWTPSKLNGKHLSKSWGVRTDLGSSTVRMPVGSEPVFPPLTGEFDALVEKLSTIDFGKMVKTAKGWTPNEANGNLYVQMYRIRISREGKTLFHLLREI